MSKVKNTIIGAMATLVAGANYLVYDTETDIVKEVSIDIDLVKNEKILTEEEYKSKKDSYIKKYEENGIFLPGEWKDFVNIINIETLRKPTKKVELTNKKSVKEMFDQYINNIK